MSQSPLTVLRTPPLTALCGWLLPGAGYLVLGQIARGLCVGITIIVLFVLGLLIGGVKVVDPPPNFLSDPVRGAMNKPWFVAQVLTGPIAPIASAIGRGEGFVVSHARVNEIGTLYTAIAGMLNLLTIIDSAWRAGREGASP